MSAIPRRRRQPIRKIAVIGTFHNPNWYISHISPLAASGVEEVLLVCDSALQPLPKVTFRCPPSWIRFLFGRAVAKFIWLIVVGVKDRPDLFVGYHILPGAVSALLAGTLLGQPTCYQMTGGPIEIEGGGDKSESWLSGSIGSPSPWLERCAVALVREFDLVVVRGTRAKAFLEKHGVNGRTRVITGSIPRDLARSKTRRKYDIVFVGRLADIKQPSHVLQVAADLAETLGQLQVAMVGDGPLLGPLTQQAKELGILANVDFLGQRSDVMELLGDSRVFLLTSRSEGLPIAMLEAMAMGAVPVVADVGEVRDVIDDGHNGFVVAPGDIGRYAEPIRQVLQSAFEWRRMSQAARELAVTRHGLDAIAASWRSAFDDVAAQRHSRSEASMEA